MSTVNDEWEALPPRKRNRNRNEHHIEASVSDKPCYNHPARTTPKHQKDIEDAVYKRSIANRAHNDLGAKDDKTSYGRFHNLVDLDHTADVQCHAWGDSLQSAFEHIIPCMFNYATDLSAVDIDPDETINITVKDNFCCKIVKILDFDRINFSISAEGHGEIYDQSRHTQGTEIKAITYSNMQIHEKDDRTDLYVIIDI
eukprot:gene1298-2511_t